MKWTLPVFIATLLASLFLYTFYIDSEAIGWFGTLVQFAALILAAINLNMARRQYKALETIHTKHGRVLLLVRSAGQLHK